MSQQSQAQRELLIRILSTDTPLEALTEQAFDIAVSECGLQPRPHQRTYASKVAKAISTGVTAGLEAPCGSGKSLGYLIPGCIQALRLGPMGKNSQVSRLSVSTSSIALQSQIVDHDIPRVGQILGVTINVGLLKSIQNFICLEKVNLGTTSALMPSSYRGASKKAEAALNRGSTGDREHLDFNSTEWSMVSSSNGECSKSSCEFVNECIGFKERQRALDCSVLVVNHSYLAHAWPSLRPSTFALLVDEGHDLRSRLQMVSASEISERTATHWYRVLNSAGFNQEAVEVRSIISSLLARAAGKLTDSSGSILDDSWIMRVDHKKWSSDIARIGRKVSAVHGGVTKLEGVRNARLSKGLSLLNTKLGNLFPSRVGENPNMVRWVEADGRGRPGDVVVKSQNLDPILVKGGQQGIVITSATMDPKRTPHSVGLTPTISSSLPSPWPLDEMAVLCVPGFTDPTPKDPGWPQWSAERCVEFVQECGGGVLVLATSWAGVERLHKALVGAGIDAKEQGSMSRSMLKEWFKHNHDGVLVATRAFFQGVDIPGDSLRAVFLDRLPFPAPSVLLNMEMEIVETFGLDGFRNVILAEAVQVFKQAFGRLIRSRTDRGAFYIADSRISRHSYGKIFKRSVAPVRWSHEIQDAGRLLRGEGLLNSRMTPGKRMTARR